MRIYTQKESIIFENNRVKISVSALDSMVESIVDKAALKDIKGENTHFFSLIKSDKKTEIYPYKISLANDELKVSTELGDFTIKVQAEDDYFTFELTSILPESSYKAMIAHAKYNYDYENKANCGAVGIAMTYWANPCFYPDAKDKETKAEVTSYLKDKGAKYGLIIAPVKDHLEIIKALSSTIDKTKGIVSSAGGVWSKECPLCYENSSIQFESSKEFIDKNLDFFELIGVDQIDFHKGTGTIIQGDFKFGRYKNAEEFKENVSDKLENRGMHAGLHTYSAYVDFECESILSNPRYQKDLSILAVFTLSEDVDGNSDTLKTVESTENVSCDFSFMAKNTPYLLIGEEIVKFSDVSGGFNISERGVAGTKAVSHKKGEKIYHIDGYYRGIAPVPGSELFFDVAKNTAKAFNEGGFKTIYLDALEGIKKHIDDTEDAWFYYAAFIHEILEGCIETPLIEASILMPCFWAARGRYGAYDPPFRGYKRWNEMHVKNNKVFDDRYVTSTLGWYSLYLVDKRYPGNLHIQYQHTDDVEHLGSLALSNDINMVYTFLSQDEFNQIPALKRNALIYKKYDYLRKKKYFSKEILEKVKTGKYEYHIDKTPDDGFVLREKKFERKNVYNLSNERENTASFNNPFDSQMPFVRIEALLTENKKADSVMVCPFDKNESVSNKSFEKIFEKELDLSGRLAKKISVCGNGKKCSAIAIKIYGKATGIYGLAEYFIDTDFEGWRDFVLIESDNGLRPDLPFDYTTDTAKEPPFRDALHRTSAHEENVYRLVIEKTGDVSGVKLSDLVATEYDFAEIKNPTVKIGDSSVTFNCNLKSCDFIEFDGNAAKMIDGLGNETLISFTGELVAPSGEFCAELCEEKQSNALLRARLTLGFTGDIIK